MRKEAVQVIYGREHNPSREASRYLNVKRLQAVLWNTKVHQRVQVISPSTETSSHHYHSANVPYSFIYHQEEGKRTRQKPQLHRRFLTQPDEQKEHTKIEYSLTRTTEENE